MSFRVRYLRFQAGISELKEKLNSGMDTEEAMATLEEQLAKASKKTKWVKKKTGKIKGAF